jgi:hypothetical protein
MRAIRTPAFSRTSITPLKWCEDRTLDDDAGAPAAAVRSIPLEHTFGDAADGRKLLRYLDRLVISTGEVLVREGDVTD